MGECFKGFVVEGCPMEGIGLYVVIGLGVKIRVMGTAFFEIDTADGGCIYGQGNRDSVEFKKVGCWCILHGGWGIGNP